MPRRARSRRPRYPASSGEDPAVLPVDPGAARSAADDRALGGQQREDARRRAHLGLPACASAKPELRREQRVVAREFRRECLAARLQRAKCCRSDVVDPTPRLARDAARGDESLEPTPLACCDDARARRVDDGNEVARDDPERAPHAEHADELPGLVEVLLQVGGAELPCSRPGREVDGSRVRGVQRHHRLSGIDRSVPAVRRREPMTAREPRPALVDVDPLHRRRYPRAAVWRSTTRVVRVCRSADIVESRMDEAVRRVEERTCEPDGLEVVVGARCDAVAKPIALAIASTMVDFPVPLSPARSVIGASRRSSLSAATAGTSNGSPSPHSAPSRRTPRTYGPRPKRRTSRRRATSAP